MQVHPMINIDIQAALLLGTFGLELQCPSGADNIPLLTECLVWDLSFEAGSICLSNNTFCIYRFSQFTFSLTLIKYKVAKHDKRSDEGIEA